MVRVKGAEHIFVTGASQLARVHYFSSSLFRFNGQVSEWLKEPVSKTGKPVRVSRVRIPPCPFLQLPIQGSLPSRGPVAPLPPSTCGGLTTLTQISTVRYVGARSSGRPGEVRRIVQVP